MAQALTRQPEELQVRSLHCERAHALAQSDPTARVMHPTATSARASQRPMDEAQAR